MRGTKCAEAECLVQDCHKPPRGLGWCGMHHQRWLRYGDVHYERVIVGDDERRFWSKVDKNGSVSEFRPDLGHCWQWLGSLSVSGYGTIQLKGSTVQAHRWIYEHTVGLIPDDLVIDHLCRNRACINPAHMEIVTRAENTRRGLRGELMTHCANGHPFNEENTIPRSPAGGRRCRICRRETLRRHALKKRSAERELVAA